MNLTIKMKELLKRRKQQLRDNCKCNGRGCVKCGDQFNVLLKLAEAGVPTKFWDYTLDTCDYLQDNTRSKVQSYINKIDKAFNKGIGLYCYGSNGVGKTLCVSIILKETIKKGYSARFTNLSEAITILSNRTFNRNSDSATYQKEIIEVDFLVLDDLTKIYKNTENQTSVYIDSVLDQLFRTRANSCLPTLLTANATRGEAIKSKEESFALGLLSLFDEHLLDIHFMGKDIRNNKHKINKTEFFEED